MIIGETDVKPTKTDSHVLNIAEHESDQLRVKPPSLRNLHIGYPRISLTVYADLSLSGG